MISQLLGFFQKFRDDQEGASLVEYGLLVSLIALAVIAALTTVGTNLSTLFTKISANIN